MSENKYPSEVIELPSGGWFYPENHPLASGKLEIYYMTAKHEDILTSTNLIQRGVVLDKLMEALIVDKSIKYDDLLLGDKNGVVIAARILGYGKDYEVSMNCPSCGVTSDHKINLEDITDKPIETTPENKGKNEFPFKLPISGRTITFKLLTHGDEKAITNELAALKKALKAEVTTEVTTRIRKMIVSVDGDKTSSTIRDFVDAMPARDAMAFREHIKTVNPDIDLTFPFVCPSCGLEQRMEVPIDVTFFWPNAKV
jgi:predicted RNA-binding Zn-ribbon protein involved in translation (DUF1610 family)